MKKSLQKILLLSALTFSSVAGFSQYNYWNGVAASFDAIKDSAGTSSISIGSAAKTASGVWFMDSVTNVYGWYVKNYYQAGSTGLCTGQTKDIRMPKTTTAPNYGCLATPYLGYGVNKISYLEGRGRKTAIYYTTSDTTVSTYSAAGSIPSNWIFADSTSNTKCVARSVTINNAAARRVIFINALSSGDEDVDSIAITSVNVITPVVFGGISASEANSFVKLNWNIETETNTNNYIVERSVNGDNFVQVGTLKANKSANYIWIDNTPNNGVNYYRIRATDNNGTYQYSTIVRINVGKTKSGLNVYPNPVKGGQVNVELNGISKGVYVVNIFNMNGSLAHTTTLFSEGTSLSKSVTLPSNLKTGNYTLEITNGSFKTTKLISVQ
jgi:hypothetical protein